MVPLKWLGGVQTSDSPEESSVLPATTAMPFLVSVPSLTASMRNEIALPSISASFAAAASDAYVIVNGTSSDAPLSVATLDSVGAMLPASATVMETPTAVLDASEPSNAVTVKPCVVPLNWLGGVQTSDSPVESSVLPATTAMPFLVSVPALTASTRNESVSPSTSASFAADASAA